MALETISRHTAYVMERGGKRRIGQIKNLSLVRYNRIRDDISEATIRLHSPAPGSAQADLLNKIHPNRHELCLFRNGERVWEGPISLPKFTRNTVEVAAKDVMLYAYRTVMHAAYDSRYPAFESGEKVVARALRVLNAELARKEALTPAYNVLPHVVAHQAETDAETTSYTLPYQFTVFEHIDNMAAKKGMDYTVLGRAIHLWDTSREVFGRTRVATENDFLGDVIVSLYGMEFGSISHVTDGRGNVGSAGAIDDYYGEWERLETAYDENDIDAVIPSVAEMESQAIRNLGGRNPTPMQIRVPDNSQINPAGILQLKDLVPGRYIPVRAQIGIKKVTQVQKLNRVTVEETPAGEKITVAMYPATAPDEEAA